MNWFSPSRLRLILLAMLFGTAVVMLLARVWRLQIKERETYIERIPGTSTVTVRVPPSRGRIFDRGGRELVKNEVSYESSFDLEALKQAYLHESGSDLPTISYNVPVSGSVRTRQNEEADIVSIFKDMAVPRLDLVGLAENFHAGKMRTHYRTHRGLIPWVYRDNLGYDEFARFAENTGTVPGLEARFRPQRRYVYGAMASHLLGYMRKPETGDLPEHETGSFDHFRPDDIGAAGIERSMERFLRGRPGRRTMKRSEKGRVLGEIGFEPPQRGADVYLTLDAEFQMLAEQVMRSVGRGAAVVMDVHNGDILAMASVPSYDPNHFIPSITRRQYDTYIKDPAQPLLCLALKTYEPGSNYKIVSAAAAGLAGLGNAWFTCTGGVQYGNKFKKCWIFGRGAHGSLDMTEAIQRSCNSWFYLLGNAAGPEPFVQAAELMGFGRPTGLEVEGEDGGIVMGSRYWREVVRREPDRGMTTAELANMVIGQGETKASPVQVARMTAAVANGGKVLRPRLVGRVVDAGSKLLWPDGSGGRRSPNQPVVEADLVKEGVPAEVLEQIREGMYRAVNEPGGTAGRARIEGAVVCGKTGSAQTIIRGEKGTHAWFTGFTPRENPRYAITVVVLGGLSGGKVAAPLARAILEGIFAVERARILPGSGARPRLTYLQPAPGHFDAVEEISLEEDGTLAVTTDVEESPEIRPARVVQLPAATIAEAPDEEGMVVRRAIPVAEPPASPAPDQ